MGQQGRENVEIRTPNDNLLMCTVVVVDGRYYAEIKRNQKIDRIELERLINILRSYNKILIM